MRKRSLLLLFLFIFIVANAVIFISIYQRSLAPTDSGAAGIARTVLTLVSPTSVEGVPVGTNITVSFAIQNTTNVSAAEVYLNYNPAVLEATSLTASTGVLSLAPVMNNVNGIASIDLVKEGPGDFPNNSTLLTIVFRTKSSTTASTTITTGNQTVLISPSSTTNQIAADGYGSLLLKFIVARCGDGTVQAPNDSGINEACDAGAANGTACTPAYGSSCTYCSSTCTNVTVQGPRCGDGTRQQPQEQCDSGAQNGTACTAAYGSSCTYCSSTCTNVTVQGPRCGDGVKQTQEQCDAGAQNGVTCNPAYGGNCTYCSLTCANVTLSGGTCGDGIRQTPEACDDSNTAAMDTCNSSCTISCPDSTDTVAASNKCLPRACRANYTNTGASAGWLDVQDFAQFASYYRQTGLACSNDIIIENGTCFLNIADFAKFASIYKVANACQ